MVVQSPKTSLDPLCRIGDQLIRIHRAHTNAGTAEARSRAIEVLDSVGIPDPARRMNAWPHELSGGMAQRVLIALALINRPRLLIADEPTTGLDVTVQAQILDLIRARVNKDRLGAIIITHDLGVVAQYCDRVLVMYAGSIVEAGPVEQVFTEPHHPYSVNLLNATPDRFKGRGSVSAGAPPDIFSLPEGCAYRANCARAGDLCHSSPALRVDGSRTVFGHYPIETAQRGSQCDIRY
jgi:peptide/nickel transport system ATP-binding protein/oligopeptide transport system ATP-binding protein